MTRAILIVLDSVGCGGAEDAKAYGDEGADTLGHIAEACADGQGRSRRPEARPAEAAAPRGARARPGDEGFDRPRAAGLCASRAARTVGLSASRPRAARTRRPAIGSLPERRSTSTGAISPRRSPPFPEALTEALIAEGKLAGILANRHASGTAVIADYGEEHLRTLKPICYTSANSVLQIAAHEEAFGLERLYDLCRIARRLCDPLNIGRVIARPFVGAKRQGLRPHRQSQGFRGFPAGRQSPAAGRARGPRVVSIGKIGDIFAHRDTGDERKGKSNDGNVDLLIEALRTTADGGLIFVNLVDFDTEWGHRRDVPGYAACLEAFDARLGAIEAAMRPQDYCVITADHGNDPTFRGFDHTREHVPILAFGGGAPAGPIGARSSLADVAETIAVKLGLPRGPHGRAWAA